MKDAAQARLEEIEARAKSFYGFFHRYLPDHTFGQDGLAELSEDGKTWRYWDMRCPYSHEACEFIASAKPDIEWLIDQLQRARAERDSLREGFDEFIESAWRMAHEGRGWSTDQLDEIRDQWDYPAQVLRYLQERIDKKSE